jgi:hypothetical protein
VSTSFSVVVRGLLCGGLAASVVVKLCGRLDSAVAAAAPVVEVAILVAFMVGRIRFAGWCLVAASMASLVLSLAFPDMQCNCLGEWGSPSAASRRMIASLAGALAASLLVLHGRPSAFRPKTAPAVPSQK